MKLGIIGIYLGVMVFFIAMAIGVLVRKPSKRFPDPPPGYYEWLNKTNKPRQ